MSSDKQSLPAGLASSYGDRLGVDLSDVQVHTGPDAAARSEDLGARAYAEGTEVHFGEGEYDPDSAEGQELLAHELAHVAQAKGSSSGKMTKRSDGVSVGDHEHDADRVAHSLVHGTGPVQVAAAPAAGVMRKAAAPDKKAKPKPKSLDDIRRVFLEGTHEMEAMKNEVIAQDHKSEASTGGLVDDSMTQRASASIIGMFVRLAPLMEDIKALNPGDKQQLVLLAEALLFQAGGVKANRENALGPQLLTLNSLLTNALGELKIVDAFTAYRSGAGLGETAADRAAEAAQVIDQAMEEITAGISPEQKDLVGPAGMGRIDALHGILKGMDAASKAKLEPKVNALIKTAHSASKQYDMSPRVHELFARVNAMLPLMGIDAMSPDTVGKVLDAEHDAAKGYTQKQFDDWHAEFVAIGESLHGALDDLYDQRSHGVDDAEKSAAAKENPPAGPAWLDFAVFALTLASGGIGGAILGKVGEKFAEGAGAGLVEKLEAKLSGAVKDAVKDMPGELLKKGGDMMTERVLDKGKDMIKGEGGGPEMEHNEETGLDGKIAFFSGQKKALGEAKTQTRTQAIGITQALSGDFAKDPQAAVAGMKKASAMLRNPDAEAQTRQMNATIAQWATLVLGNDIDDRTAAGGVDMSGQIDGKLEQIDNQSIKHPLREVEHHTDFKHYKGGEVTLEIIPTPMPVVTGAWVKNMGPDLRSVMGKMPLGENNVPMRGILVGGDAFSAKTRIARNDKGEGFAEADDAGVEYLRTMARHGGKKADTDQEAKEEGAKYILGELIGSKPLAVTLHNVDTMGSDA